MRLRDLKVDCAGNRKVSICQGIVLSASVRQNLLSLQSTADLLSTTQNRLATGKKVNTALDNPTNFFTAAGLDSRAGDINSLLDGIGNGVQVLQAANTGITSLQKLVDTAKSIANQALQIPVGYNAKSSFTTPINPGATADNLLGTSTKTDNTYVGTVANNKNAAAITGATLLSGLAATDSIATSFAANDTITVNGQSLTFRASGASGANEINITDTVATLLGKIDALSGGAGSAVNTAAPIGAITLHTGAASDLSITSSNTAALAGLGLGTSVTQARTSGPTALGGPPALTPTIAATNPSSTATNITFGTASGQVSTLAQLNAALAPNNLQAVIDPAGFMTIQTSNDAASSTIGAIGGTAAAVGKLFNGLVPSTPVQDFASRDLARQSRRAVQQHHRSDHDHVARMPRSTASTCSVAISSNWCSTRPASRRSTSPATTLTPAGLGLSKLAKGADFLDNTSANNTLAALNISSSVLRAQASALGSNLSIVQIRREFAKNLINVLQTGSSNLTLADTNEEAANSQALSTRQSIAVSALALANQSQQSVLKLLQ